MLSAILNPLLRPYGLEARDVEGGVLILDEPFDREAALTLARALAYRPDPTVFPPMRVPHWEPTEEPLAELADWLDSLDPCPAFVFEFYCDLISGRTHPVVLLNKARIMQFDASEAERPYWRELKRLMVPVYEASLAGLGGAQ